MKRWIAAILAACMLIFPGYALGEEASQAEGVLLLSVSKITFSLPGEQEDIYTGTADRQQIVWESDDPEIAVFEDGVVRTVAAGTTTIRATLGEQVLECQVICLANSGEELKAVGRDVLQSANRLPQMSPEGETCDFFDDAVFIGDSITYTLWYQAEATKTIGEASFLVRGGCSLNGFVLGYYKITYHGVEMELDDAIALTGAKKVFFMMGQNDLSYRTIDETMGSWEEVLASLRESDPSLDIYIQSLVPEWKEQNASNAKNEKIQEYNERLKTFAEENGCHFVEIAAYFRDNTNRMAKEYTSDYTIHINFDGADIWMQVLRAYAREQKAKEAIA